MSDALQELFAGRELLVATMHAKERAIAPAFLESFALASCRAIAGLDTDRFGAFSGEVRRALDPRSTAEAKARAGAALAEAELVIASEGSFGPHPASPFLSCDEEWLVLWDARSGLARAHRYLTTEVVCGGTACTQWDEVRAFAARVPFPSHGLVLRPEQRWSPGDPVRKDLLDLDALEAAARELLRDHDRLWVELDLRAHRNPTRLRAIERAAHEFASELARLCPRCGAAHYRVVEALPGLPCGECGEPTRSVRARARACADCHAREEEPRADGKLVEDPGFCELCNP